MKKKCTNKNCRKEYEATLDNFAPDRKSKDGLNGWCRVCHRAICREYKARHKAELRAKNKVYQEMYRCTIEGCLRAVYGGIKRRCSGESENPKDRCYVRNDTKNMFRSSDAFVDYVVNTLKVDPRGLQIHRIDNDGHYEPGNIEFITKLEHGKIHAEMRKT